MPSAFRIGRRVATVLLVSATLILLVIATLGSRTRNSSREDLPTKSQAKNFKLELRTGNADVNKLSALRFESSPGQHLKAVESFLSGHSYRANQYPNGVAKVPELESFRTSADESQTGEAAREERKD